MRSDARKSPRRSGHRAVVIGASLAGLIAARVLRDAFDEVVIVERDRLPDGPEPRSGVPQSKHIHALLVRGAQVLEELFPGFRDEMVRGGTPTLEWPTDFLWLAPAGWIERKGKPIEVISASREYLDWVVRNRVLTAEGVRLLGGHDATGLVASPDGTRVKGVTIRARADGSTTTIEADLIVDASGRNSRAPAWLTSLGYPAPAQSVVNAFIGYASRLYAAPEGTERDWKAVLLNSRPPDLRRAGGIFPVNGGLWHVTVSGTGRDYPPIDEEGFLAFARSLRSPVVADALADATPVSPISGYRQTENQLRHYERMSSWPEGFVVLGDATSAFNPVYGQGMSVAGLAGLALQQWLDTGGTSAAFQRRLAKVVATPWVLATSEDFRFPTTEGGRPGATTRLTHRYLDRVIAVATVDHVVFDTFIRVVHLVEPPTALFRPAILARVMRGPRREPPLTPPPAPKRTLEGVGARTSS